MVINLFSLLSIVVIALGLWGSVRGLASVGLMAGSIFFAIVVLLLAGDALITFVGKFGLVLSDPGSQNAFLLIAFLLIVAASTTVLGNVADLPGRAESRGDKVKGLLGGLFDGFLIVAVIDHYVTAAIQGSDTAVGVGVPGISFTHPTPNTWQFSIIPNALTVAPTTPGGDLWSKLPGVLLLLLLVLAIVFAGILYGRLNRGRGRG